MKTLKLFLASSAELLADRRDFEIFVNRKNKEWVKRGVFLELAIWEDFLDAMSRTRLQDEYNRAIRECGIFVMLFWTKVGRYTAEEFATAFGQFQATGKPFIFTYFKNAPVSPADLDLDDLTSLKGFQRKLKDLGHFQTPYANAEGLQLHFGQQLEKLAAEGLIDFKPEAAPMPGIFAYYAELAGEGAIAQGPGAKAAGVGGVIVEGDNQAPINIGGTQTNIRTDGGAYVAGSVSTGGGDFIGRDRIVREPVSGAFPAVPGKPQDK